MKNQYGLKYVARKFRQIDVVLVLTRTRVRIFNDNGKIAARILGEAELLERSKLTERKIERLENM